MAWLAEGEGDTAEVSREGDAAILRRPTWRLMRGLEAVSPAVFEAWNGLHEGLCMALEPASVVEPRARLDLGDGHFEWRIRLRPRVAVRIP